MELLLLLRTPHICYVTPGTIAKLEKLNLFVSEMKVSYK